jgi:hypothetical protein
LTVKADQPGPREGDYYKNAGDDNCTVAGQDARDRRLAATHSAS